MLIFKHELLRSGHTPPGPPVLNVQLFLDGLGLFLPNLVTLGEAGLK